MSTNRGVVSDYLNEKASSTTTSDEATSQPSARNTSGCGLHGPSELLPAAITFIPIPDLSYNAIENKSVSHDVLQDCCACVRVC